MTAVHHRTETSYTSFDLIFAPVSYVTTLWSKNAKQSLKFGKLIKYLDFKASYKVKFQI